MRCKVLGILLLAGLSAESATLTATSGQAPFRLGDTVPVNVVLSNVSDLYAFQFDLSFNSSILSGQSIAEAGYFLSNGVSFSSGIIDNAAGRISFIADTLSGGLPTLNGSTTLVSITFTAIGAGTTNIAPINIILLDSQLSDISTSAAAGTVQVSSVPESSGYLLTIVGLTGFLCARFFAARTDAQR